MIELIENVVEGKTTKDNAEDELIIDSHENQQKETINIGHLNYIKTEKNVKEKHLEKDSGFLVSKVIKLSKIINIRRMSKKDFKN